VKHQLLAVIAAFAFVALALLSGAHQRGALLGAAISGLTGVASILAMGRFARGGLKVVQRALAVFVVAFLVRLALVGLGVFLVVRSGASVVAFVVAFFVPYFALSLIEGAFIHSLTRESGPTA
jgi:hypothetical protein